ALFGAWPWSQVPELPPELMLLPSRAPLSIYDFACWARQTVVALSIVLAVRLRGYPTEHPVMKAGLDGLERFTVEEEPSRRLEACQSPVWDTALAMVALADAG